MLTDFRRIIGSFSTTYRLKGLPVKVVNYVLTDAKLKALKFSDRPPQKPKTDGKMPKPDAAWKVTDGGGLFVKIAANDTKSWHYKFTFNGRPREMSFGLYPTVSIRAARALHEAARESLAAGVDPAAAKQEEKRKARYKGDLTFAAFAKKWYALKEAKCRPVTLKRIDATLKRHILPALGKLALDAIEPQHIHAIISDNAATPATATQIRGIIKDLFDTAISNLLIKTNPATSLKVALIIPVKPTRNHRHLTPKQLGIWWRALAACEGPTHPVTINAAKFIAYTMTRKSEVLFATYGELEGLDGDEPMLVIPAARMKMKRDFICPLSRQAVAIIREQIAAAQAAGRDCGNDEYIFQRPFGRVRMRRGEVVHTNEPLDINTLNFLFARIADREGLEFCRTPMVGLSDSFTPHGLRSTATSILRDRGFSRSLVDLLLAHGERGVHASYNRAEELPARRAALQFYADLIDGFARDDAAPSPAAEVAEAAPEPVALGSNVVALPFGRRRAA